MHHGDLQGKRIIFIATINFIDGSAEKPLSQRGDVSKPSII